MTFTKKCGTIYTIGGFMDIEKVSPEGALVANKYLELGCDVAATASFFNLSREDTSDLIMENKKYINSVLREVAFNKMDSISQRMEEIIEKKLEMLEEAETTSNKDILDILNVYHKMLADKVKLMTEHEKLGTPANQSNTQVNVYGEGNYGKLLEKLITGK